jgi:DNA polymerase
MSLQLDRRQRAMLAEMGIRVFEPLHEAAVPAPAAGDRPSPQRASTEVRAGAVAAIEQAVQAPALDGRAAGIALMQWDELAQSVASCRACKLCSSRRKTVFGVGDTRADWLIVGEAPGENEDLQGEPFVGAAGQLLDNMLRAIGLDRRHKVYIANVLKCRPPGNRNPLPEEVAMCEPFLRRQVQLLQPRIILAMGRFAVQSLLGTSEPIGKLRGRAHQYLGLPVVVTYHPAYLLRNLPDKARAWADLCLALALMDSQPV